MNDEGERMKDEEHEGKSLIHPSSFIFHPSIKAIALDVDGVLTDGSFWWGRTARNSSNSTSPT